jgi:hypothetical protein
MKPFFTTLFLLVIWPAALMAQFFDNFESDSLSGWLQHPAGRWAIVNNMPLSGNASLKHSYPNTAATTDIVYRELTGVVPSESSCTWRFILRHGFNSSGNNKWGVMLMANAPANEWRSGGAYQGYVIGINMGSSTGDTLSLYAVRNNTFSFVRKTSINWKTDIGVNGAGAVEVVRSGEGEWTIRAAAGNNFDLLAPVAQPVFHSTYTDAHYFGLMYTHTVTASQLLWLDEVSLDMTPVAPPPDLVYGDVVFSEIMAKADPSAGLPEVQYMELYNRSGREVRLDGWKIHYNNTVGNIGSAVMPDSSYLILCMSSMVPLMRDYGNAVSVTNISALTKTGKTLQLKNNKGTTLSQVSYSDKWIEEEDKRAGGWSIEKIDADNLSELPNNWAVSQAAEGGTPGRKNSIQAMNLDTGAPFVTELQLIDKHHLTINISEWFNINAALEVSAYKVNNGSGHPAEVFYNEENPLSLVLYFLKAFESGIVYELMLQAPFCDLAGNVPAPVAYTFADLTTPAPGDIVINEVLFHPFPGGTDFVELFNRSDKIFNGRDLKLANRNRYGDVASITGCTSNYYFYPGDYLVFTTGLEDLLPFYSVPFPEKVIPLPGLPSYPNTEGCVVLLNSDDTIIEEFCYTDKMHSAFISKPAGISLERIHPQAPVAGKSSWQSAAQLSGWATPTYRNSQYTDEQRNAIHEFALPYNVFSPDDDGVQDILYIDYNLPEAGYCVTVIIYDVQGRPVRDLERNTLLGVSGRLSWDGTRDNGQKVPIGIYIIYINAYNTQGVVKTGKLSCATVKR